MKSMSSAEEQMRGIVAHAARIGGGAALPVRTDAIQGAGDDAGGGGLAHAAHAGEHEGVRDAVEREGASAGCGPRCPGRSGRPAWRGGICGPARGRRAAAAGVGAACGCGRWRVGEQTRDHLAAVAAGSSSPSRSCNGGVPAGGVMGRWVGGRLNDPYGDKLRLLPSGPDRVSEAQVRRRPPATNIVRARGGGKGGGCASASGQTPRR